MKYRTVALLIITNSQNLGVVPARTLKISNTYNFSNK